MDFKYCGRFRLFTVDGYGWSRSRWSLRGVCRLGWVIEDFMFGGRFGIVFDGLFDSREFGYCMVV